MERAQYFDRRTPPEPYQTENALRQARAMKTSKHEHPRIGGIFAQTARPIRSFGDLVFTLSTDKK